MRPSRALVLFGLAAVLVASGCTSSKKSASDDGGDKTTTTSAKEKEPGGDQIAACDLLTLDAVAPILGQNAQAEAGKGEFAENVSGCTWISGEKDNTKTVILTVSPAASYDTTKQTYASSAQAVSDVGTEAFTAAEGGTVVGAAKVRDRSILILVASGTDADVAAVAGLLKEAANSI